MQYVDDAVSRSRINTDNGHLDNTEAALTVAGLSDYRILRKIGRGGMGTVYEAEQVSLGRPVALKVLDHSQDADAKATQRFRREAIAAGSLVHPHLVPVYEVGEQEGCFYYAMQLIEGQPLNRLIADLPDQPTDGAAHDELATTASALSSSCRNKNGYYEFVARIGSEVADALEHAHQNGIIHRDVKPSNLLVDVSLSAWVTDFGLAKLQDSDLTQTGDVMGTVRYMAPEQFRGWADPRSEVYGLGVTLYELLALHPPHEAADRIELIRKITDQEPPPLKSHDTYVPGDLARIIHKALRQESTERYQSAADLRDDLQRFLNGESIHARNDSLIYRTRKAVKRYRAALIAATLVVGALAIGMLGMAIALNYANIMARENETLVRTHRHKQYGHDISQAFESLHLRRTDQVREILARQVPDDGLTDLRGVEWDLLDAITKPPSAITLAGHIGAVNEIAVVPGKSQIVSAGEDGTIRVWSDQGGDPIRTIKARGYPLHSVAVSDDGKYVAAGDRAPGKIWCRASTWALADGRRIRDLQDVPCTVESLEFSPDGQRIAIGERDNSVWLVNVSDGRRVARQACDLRNKKVCFSRDGQHLIYLASTEGRNNPNYVQLWDAKLRGPPVEFPSGKTNTMAISSDQQWLATAGENDNRVHLHRLGGEHPCSVFLHGGARVTSIAFSPDGRQLALAHVDGLVSVWRIDAFAYDKTESYVLETDRRLGGHEVDAPEFIRFLDNGTRIASAGGKRIHLWHVPMRRKLGVLYEAPADANITALEVSRDRSKLFAGLHGTPYRHNIAVWPLK